MLNKQNIFEDEQYYNKFKASEEMLVPSIANIQVICKLIE